MTLPDEAFGAALAALPQITPARLRAVAGKFGLRDAWRRVAAGDPGGAIAAVVCRTDRDTVAGWCRAAPGLEPARQLAACTDAGIRVVLHGAEGYPAELLGDPDPPVVLFVQGEQPLDRRPRAAIVGTRRCTRVGADIAFELGRDLSAAGVSIVSGLALGIDGAAHRGALAAEAAPPVAVVGSGLDVIYPRRHGELWRSVAARGVVLSEAALGAQPEPWRFPARNRLIAALADVVVVVESHERGGSLLTVDEADRRSVDVLAVPGSVRSPASRGTNGLLAEGRAPVRDATDVLVALGLLGLFDRRSSSAAPSPTGRDAEVLDAFEWQPVTLDLLAMRTNLPLADLAAALARLESDGWVVAAGGWYERATPDRTS